MPQTFGDLLRELRLRAGITQNELARRSVLDHSYISRLESGARQPWREPIDVLVDALDVSDDERRDLLRVSGFVIDEVREPVLRDLDRLMASYALDTHKRQSAYAVVIALLDYLRHDDDTAQSENNGGTRDESLSTRLTVAPAPAREPDAENARGLPSLLIVHGVTSGKDSL
jgi:transcriptional regulator with XRE-family HTH domain